MPRLEKEAAARTRTAPPLLDAAEAAQEVLDAGRTLFSRRRSTSTPLRELQLLTAKPFLYVFNVDEDELADDDAAAPSCAALVAPAEAIFLDAKIESELVELPRRGGRASCSQSIGQDEPGLDQLARVGFDTLGLQTYLTAGPEGVARLDDPRGRDRPAGRRRDPHRLPARLHQGRGRLATTTWSTPARWPRPRPRGKVRIEGKDYVMHDGDVVEFRFNV